MGRFVEAFLKGEIDPQDRPTLDYLKKDRIISDLDRHEEYLKETLTGETKERLLAYIDAWDRNLILTDDTAFCAGFRLGARCMMDILQE